LFFSKEFHMAVKDYLPQADAQLLAWSTNFNTLINGRGPGFGLTSAQASEYTTKHTAYATAYTAAFEPNTRTRPKITIKDEAKKQLSAYARELVRIVQSYPQLTDDQRRELMITVPKQRSPQPPPTVRPAITIVGVTGRSVTIKIRDNGESSKRGKPDGAMGAVIFTYFGDVPPADIGEWRFERLTSQTRIDLPFHQHADAGTAWVCAMWFNRRSETGPMSQPVNVNLPAAGVMVSGAVRMKIAA
jgi:hypothetical protein